MLNPFTLGGLTTLDGLDHPLLRRLPDLPGGLPEDAPTTPPDAPVPARDIGVGVGVAQLRSHPCRST